MTNHVQLVAIPKRANSLARAIGQGDGRYSQWFNRRHGRIGHLWQARFKSCALGHSFSLTARASASDLLIRFLAKVAHEAAILDS